MRPNGEHNTDWDVAWRSATVEATVNTSFEYVLVILTDDIMIWTAVADYHNDQSMKTELQAAIPAIADTLDHLGLQLSPEKTEWISMDGQKATNETTSHQKSLPWRGVKVYPRVLESRGSASEKVLVVAAGYSLDLRKASVLADSVLMRDLTDSGVVETYIAGKEHERHLYQDSEKMASVFAFVQVGLLNSTHRIQPVKASERSSKGTNAHEILPIKTNDGVSGVIEAAHNVYRERVVNFRPTARSISLPENFTIELAFCSDYYHTKAFGKDTKARVHYVITMVLAVSLRLQQLSPPGFISIVSIQGSSTKKEPYVAKLNESVLLGTETLRNLSKYADKSSKMRQADVVFLITG
ncbi:hypothetical protein MRX96_041103 [Rhipicephalus microplus]